MRHPNVPESLDGRSILHTMYRFNRRRWEALHHAQQPVLIHEANALFTELATNPEGDCGLLQLLGDTGDLQITHYARSFDALGVAEARVQKLGLADFLEPMSSYVSVMEPLAEIAADPRNAACEMRFDAASARYGEFGRFWTGVQFSIAALPDFLAGERSPQRLAEREPVLR